ncbi:UvrD-helicase domain-containing protein [Verrucosispora sp. NA02020]|uniref:UvrD-helicase domain-containing protein n=1 Tax=Verrucosispora sp. NA02020 TaxID=2742132 RepID=UPI003D71B505
MTSNYVFSIASLQACLVSAETSWFADMPGDQCSQWQVERVDLGDTTYFIHESDEPATRRIAIVDQEPFGVANSRWMKKSVLERVHRAAIVAAAPPVSLPRDWHAFHHKNLFSFFGSRRTKTDRMSRWTVENRPQESVDVLFWRFSPPNHIIALQDFRPDYTWYEEASLFWDEALKEARTRFSGTPRSSDLASPMVALNATFDATSRGRTYADWLPHLSDDQRQFLERMPPVKLRGPAGTGKTLCLLLKAIREVTQARVEGKTLRVLFLTHSWAMETQIDRLLRTLNGGNAIDEIDVFPLFSAGSMLFNTTLPAGLEPLGEDSHDGKQEQFTRVKSLLSKAVKTDWPAYRSRTRPEFAQIVESNPESDEFRIFSWDVLNEFACVLGPEGIAPGTDDAIEEYRELKRASWMMDLEDDAEKDFILVVYGHYVDSLRADNLISSDQIINDFVKDLEKSSWQYQRLTGGYDLIFVDELHLFNEQERRALHHLTKDFKTYPKMFMALDPRQSAEVVYTGVAGRSVTREDSGRSGAIMGEVTQHSLTRVHRFGRTVLALLRHINKSWPQLDLGDDWELDLDQARAEAPSSAVPTLYRHTDAHDEARNALRAARGWINRPDGGRVAVVLVEKDALDLYEEVALDSDTVRVNVLGSRDDLVSLQYEKRTVVLAPAEYVAGLQFDTVIVAGLPRTRRHPRWPQTRHLLSQLYLAISRASRHVEIHVNRANGSLPEVLGTAISAGALQEMS